ncbi:AAR033Wp [Eremothecium gossypii ATCC 10895]|uniref:AAR033Wp n=1 Tax=Eremothecium gossypii (strain ATCC 10895 / CBS 109.51 / FGSC 9923 / NRRL Y-1056) TaxID=284811 RepID=Q75EP6_EREGS|nr:AAR033Wp [Eremothecium gossypii ATCC 10895]AAS50398.1 AAR033Wp [Eremothecium gossypii ATCC 10895]AEY94684.1 FAAR033Wp [Eremothecium gossypii FDAG1]
MTTTAAQLRKELCRSQTGYGLMGLTWRDVPSEPETAFECMRKAISCCKQGKILFNCGEFYGGDFLNLHYVRDFFRLHPARERVILCVKGAVDNATLQPVGDPVSVRKSMDNCLREIGGYIDIFECARFDPKAVAPGELYPRASIEAVVEYVKAGKIGAIGLSEVTAEQVRAISRDYGEYLACVEVEFSMLSRDILHNGLAQTCAELGIPILCYSPLARGLLTNAISTPDDVPAGDLRRLLARFGHDALANNLQAATFLQEHIIKPRAPPPPLPAVALAWIRSWSGTHKGTHFLPIPGATTPQRVEESLSICELTPEELDSINAFLEQFTAAGRRDEFLARN